MRIASIIPIGLAAITLGAAPHPVAAQQQQAVLQQAGAFGERGRQRHGQQFGVVHTVTPEVVGAGAAALFGQRVISDLKEIRAVVRIGIGKELTEVGHAIAIAVQGVIKGREVLRVKHFPRIGDPVSIGVRHGHGSGLHIYIGAIQGDPPDIRPIGVTMETARGEIDARVSQSFEMDPPDIGSIGEAAQLCFPSGAIVREINKIDPVVRGRVVRIGVAVDGRSRAEADPADIRRVGVAVAEVIRDRNTVRAIASKVDPADVGTVSVSICTMDGGGGICGQQTEEDREAEGAVECLHGCRKVGSLRGGPASEDWRASSRIPRLKNE